MPLHKLRRAAGFAKPDFSYRARYTSTSSLSSHTFTSCDIGAWHPKRLVVVALYTRNSSISSVTIGGVSASQSAAFTSVTNCRVYIYSARVPSGTTADITVTYSSSGNGFDIGVYAGYPESETPVDTAGNGSGGSNFTLSNLAKTEGGFAVFIVAANADTAVCSLSGTGPETIAENYDSNEIGWSIAGYSFVVSATSATDDYTVSTTTSNNEGAVGATWGP